MAWCKTVVNSIANALKLLQSCAIDGLVQERCNSIANALELNLTCTNLLKWDAQTDVHICFAVIHENFLQGCISGMD